VTYIMPADSARRAIAFDTIAALLYHLSHSQYCRSLIGFLHRHIVCREGYVRMCIMYKGRVVYAANPHVSVVSHSIQSTDWCPQSSTVLDAKCSDSIWLMRSSLPNLDWILA